MVGQSPLTRDGSLRSTCKQGEITLLIVDTTPPISHREKARIWEYIILGLGYDQKFPCTVCCCWNFQATLFRTMRPIQALIVYLRRFRCLFEKKNTKVQVKVYTFEIPMKNVGTIWSFQILYRKDDVVLTFFTSSLLHAMKIYFSSIYAHTLLRFLLALMILLGHLIDPHINH